MAAPKRLSPAQIINRLRKAEVALANGNTTKEVCRELGVSEQTYYRWRREYGGMKLSQAKRLKELEKENQQLKRSGQTQSCSTYLCFLDHPPAKRRCLH